MNRRIGAITATCVLACSCVSHEGTYSPGCIAFEGSHVQLIGGQFTWEKFTDQVVLDNDGNTVNQFPDYPKSGLYRIDGQTVYLETDAGESMQDMHLHRHGDRHYLLTDEQLQAWKQSGNYADCALTLGHSGSD